MTAEETTAPARAGRGRKGAGGAKAGGAGGRKAAGAAAAAPKADPALVRMVARALWRVTGGVPEDATPEARTAAWESAKEGAMQTARALVRQLTARGVTMTVPAGRAAAEDEG
jgi:hypothetical protein